VVFTARDQARPFVEAGALGASVPILEVIEASSTFTPGDRHAARGASGVDGDPALLWVGRLDPNKDPMRVLDAVEIAMGRLPGLRLWCLFDAAPLGTAVRERLGRHPALSRGVRLVGPVPHRQVEAFCRAADLFVLGSHREGSGYALIEALACGVTPVVTDIPSFRRITRDGKVGELVPVDDAGRMAEAIVKQSGRIGEASRRRVREHFERCLSETAVADELRNAYAVLTGGA
jgi:glycosyltransferase involved in cell wall biosynthesis